MIEVLALAGAVTKIAGGISSAIKAGKDINGVMGSFGQLAKLESEIHLAESGKHKGPLGRMTSSEAEGFAIGKAKMAHKVAMDQLRSDCRLYAEPGLWDMIVSETAAARKRHKLALEAEAERRDKIFWLISVIFGFLIVTIGTGGLIWGAAILAQGRS
jgi:hypothetical protein|tara:strand:+ start:219 stop:692 length:474 start_codon:yes stop_codon:yes gene_type:complete